ncbi:cytochrome P450 [Lactarius psammicola]|nr:cytochrome P450 [Lactarius psammicola]
MGITNFTWVLGGASGRPTYFLAVTLLTGFVLYLITKLAQRAFRKLPPGPKGLPFIGDVVHIADQDWLTSPQRLAEYGSEMMYISALGNGMLVINSQRVAVDLLEKRSNIYSDRPHYISAGEFLTENLTLSFSLFGDLWHRFRRVAVEGFSKSASQHFHLIQSREAIMLALELMKSPPSPEKHFRRHASSIMLSIIYHLPPTESEEDPIVVGITDHVDRILAEVQPGSRLVEYFPWMKYIPSRFAKWKRDAQYWYIQDSLMFERLLGKVADDLRDGIDRPSFGATVLKNQSKNGLSEREQAWIVGNMFAAGQETTSTTLHWWLLAMLVYPAVQARAHAELDEVVGRARPPTFADVPSLPYLRAMVKETLRWAPITVLGMPHASIADDWYEGVFIPKGTVCVPNMRLLNSNPEVFGNDAAEFDPTRWYLDEKGRSRVNLQAGGGGREDGHVTFGYGWRVCPGRYVAEDSLMIDFATLLWAMQFERPDGARGELDTHTLVHSGVMTRPVPFEFKAVPRFIEAEALLKEALDLCK